MVCLRKDKGDGMEKVLYELRPLKENEWDMAMQLAWDTFLIYEAPEYSKEGIKHFQEYVRDPRLKEMFRNGDFQAVGAFYENAIIGILGTRGQHISLLFVEPQYHHQGIASSLLESYFAVAKKLGVDRISVNASPYAVPFYKKLGFKNIQSEVVKDGIRYTPMRIDF